MDNKDEHAIKLPAELLKPRLLKAKQEIQIKILKDSIPVNLWLGLVSSAAEGWAFEIKAPMDGVLRTEEIAHDDEPYLIHQTMISVANLAYVQLMFVHLLFFVARSSCCFMKMFIIIVA